VVAPARMRLVADGARHRPGPRGRGHRRVGRIAHRRLALDRTGPGTARPAAARGGTRRSGHAHRAGLGRPAPGPSRPAGTLRTARRRPGHRPGPPRRHRSTDERELSGIWSTASGALGAYRSTEALAATCDPDFDVAAFVRSSDTIYIAAPSHHQALVAPLVVGLLDDVRRATYARAAEEPERTRPPVVLALDELANVAPLPELPSIVSEGGGQGLLTLACFQDLSQARHRWPGQADGFPSLFGSTVVLPGIGDVATLEALSVLAGDEELVSRTVSRGHVLSGRPLADLVTFGRPQVSEQLSTHWRRRLAPDVITRGHAGHALAFDARNQPTWVGLAPAHRVEPWVSMRGTDRSIEPELRPSGRGTGTGRNLGAEGAAAWEVTTREVGRER